MTARTATRAGAARLASTIGSWIRDRRGAAAMEFALITPLLLSLYLVTMEVSQGIETNKKVGRIASMVADLVAQQQTMSPSELEGIMLIGESILQPYNRSKPTIEVTAIEVVAGTPPKAQVVWSRKLSNGTFSTGAVEESETSVPEPLRTVGTFLIRVETQLNYLPVIAWTPDQKGELGLAAAFDDIDMGERYYLRPRMSTRIPCDDC